ncbi:Uu.00g062550.m01.CDS01 [Anthostomella pinea]|uniref:Uu.00g062550.m01.CDS01 n=1 Tax=Anthostomella pinea TaxID=933095 RepID=A0AAI8VTT8_9PEZI|nr:Uu.00g062550.m01.CDS01 [Anthostomella pinea]
MRMTSPAHSKTGRTGISEPDLDCELQKLRQNLESVIDKYSFVELLEITCNFKRTVRIKLRDQEQKKAHNDAAALSNLRGNFAWS